MAKNRNGDDVDELRTFRAEFAAALGDSWDWSDFAPDSDSTPPQMEDPTSGSVPPTQLPPGGRRSVTVDVAGADETSLDGGIDESASPCDDHSSRTQLRISLPEDYAKALSRVPRRLKSHLFAAAVFGPIGARIRPDEFLAAAIQLERSGNILRQVRHLGLPAGYVDCVDKLCRWIGRVCNLRRDNRVSYSPRLPEAQAHALAALKPCEKDEFVRFALSISRAGVSHNRLVSDDYWIRIACDSIVWNLDRAPTVVPVAEVIPLIIVLERLSEGGAP
jgi:hypothetical protein